MALYDSVRPPTAPSTDTLTLTESVASVVAKQETESKQPLNGAIGSASAGCSSVDDYTTRLDLLGEQVRIRVTMYIDRTYTHTLVPHRLLLLPVVSIIPNLPRHEQLC